MFNPPKLHFTAESVAFSPVTPPKGAYEALEIEILERQIAIDDLIGLANELDCEVGELRHTQRLLERE